MWGKAFNWSGVIACSSLYGLLFLIIRYLIAMDRLDHVQFGLLLFLIPGALAALMSKDAPLSVLLLSILLASPPCLALMQLSTFKSMGLGQEVALITSAVFWCASGTIALMLIRTLMEMRRRHGDGGKFTKHS